MRCLAAALLASALAAPGLLAWGGEGHRLSGTLALQTLPPGPRAWFAGREAAFLDALVLPDEWARRDRKEGPRHYLNTEVYGGPAAVPRSAAGALAQAGRRAFERGGQVPWVIQDRQRELVAAFRAGRAEQVVQLAGILGHYVGDAQVPLHTTENHDGQLTGQRGIHGRWESGLVSRYVQARDIPVRPARTLEDAAAAPFQWLLEAHQEVPGLLAAERELGSPEDSPSARGRRRGYWGLFWERQGRVVKAQLGKAGERLGDLILTAWFEAGRPEPRG